MPEKTYTREEAKNILESVQPYLQNGKVASDTPIDTPQETQSFLDTVYGTPTEPTAGDIFKNVSIPETPQSDANAFYDQYGEFLKSQIQPIDEAKIREDAIRAMQAQIDATNKVYADQLAQAQEQGRGRLGTTTAMSARRGLIGSDFGEAQYRGTENLNRQVEQSIENERLATISALMTQARNNAAKEIADRRNALLSGYEARKQYYADAETRKQANTEKAVKSLIAQGVTPEEISTSQFTEFAKAYGLTPDELKTNYSEYKTLLDQAQAQQEMEAEGQRLENVKTQAEIDRITAEIEEGKRDATKPIESGGYIYQYDPETGFWNNIGAKYTAPTGGGTGTTTGVSNLTEGIIKGFGKLSDLTPSQRGQVISELAQSGRGVEIQNKLDEYAKSKADAVLPFIDRLLELHNTTSGGVVGLAQSKIPGTEAYDYNQLLDTIEANIAFEELTQMRAASPTGGALGQVSERELALLSRVKGSLGIGQSKEQRKENIDAIKQAFEKVKNAKTTQPNILTSPDGTQYVNISDLTEEQIKEAKDAGWTE